MKTIRRVVVLRLFAVLGLITACSTNSDEAPRSEDDRGPSPPSGGGDAGSPSPGSSSSPPSPPNVDAGADASDAGDTPPPPPPAALVSCLDAKPYVEGKCTPTTFAGWPHPAQKCTYASALGTQSVTVADASAEQVAQWIVDAGDSVPVIAQLKAADPTSYLRSLQSIAAALMIQSGRIFPLEGKIVEDLGDGPYAYPFYKGASVCKSGEPCPYCRINSLSRTEYCAYRAHQGKETDAECRARIGYGKGATPAWQDQCMNNHAAAWGKAANEHIRAQVWIRIRDSGLGATASGASVVKALDQSYGIGNSTVASFCK